jgi:hypothetical protein
MGWKGHNRIFSEELELQDLQGVMGLKVLRVAVKTNP